MLRGHRNRPLASYWNQEAGEMSVDHWLSAALLWVFITFPKIQRPVNRGGSNYWHLQAGPHPDEVAAVIWSLFLKQYWGPLLPDPDPHGALVLSLGWNHWEVLLEKRGRQEWHGGANQRSSADTEKPRCSIDSSNTKASYFTQSHRFPNLKYGPKT